MKKMKPILLVSLCLNLILIGLIIGGSLRGQKMRPPSGPTDEIAAILYSSPEEMRKDLRDKFKGIASQRGQDDERRNQLKEIISQVPFDEGELNAYFENRRDKNTSIAENAHSTLVQAIASLSDDERAAIAENLTKRPKRSDHEKRDRK